jgi:hypothetical protein
MFSQARFEARLFSSQHAGWTLPGPYATSAPYKLRIPDKGSRIPSAKPPYDSAGHRQLRIDGMSSPCSRM